MLLAALAIATTVTAREPSTGNPFEGVAIASHEERARYGELTQTVEVVEVIENSTPIDLEARWQASVPPGAAVTRVALEVDSVLVDGEVLDSERAGSIYRGIVERRFARDPELVEKHEDGTISVKVFPVPAHGSRRVLLRYTRALPRRDSGAPVAITLGQDAFYLRARVREEDPGTGPVAIVVDVSRDRSPAVRTAELAEVWRILSSTAEGREVAVLACDSACESFPETGVTARTDASVGAIAAWLSSVHGGGARDVVGAMRAAAMRVQGGRVTFVGAGRATSGVLAPDAVVRETRRVLGAISLDVVPVEDRTGALDALAVALAPPLQLPASLRAEVSKLEGSDLVIEGHILWPAPADALRVTIMGTPQAIRLTREPARAADTLLAQARIEALEKTRDPAAVERAGVIARKAHVLAQRGSFLVLESEEMFAQFGIARTPGAAKAKPPPPPPPLPKGMHRAPQLRMREAVFQISARLPSENIQLVIRENHARYRFCYEQGLRANPELAGRVSVKFVIDDTGAVTVAQDAGSDLPDPEVVSCVVEVTRKLTFSAMERVFVTVVYPFMLTPEEGTATSRPWLQLRVPHVTHSPHETWELRMRTKENPDDADALSELGQALSMDGEPLAAGHAFDALSDLRPGDRDTHLRAATSYARALDLPRALSHLTSAWPGN